MSQEVHQQEIDGYIFTVKELPAKKATLLFWRLLGLISPAAFKAGAGAKSLSLADLDIGELSTAAELLFSKLSESELENLMKTFLLDARVEVDGKDAPLWGQFDVLLQGQVLTVFKLLRFAFEANYGPLFVALGNGLRALKGAAGPESKSPSTSPGLSGGS